MTMALTGWAIDRAMAAVPPSRIADRRPIAPQRLADDVEGSQPPALLPPRSGLTRISPLFPVSHPVDDPLDRNRLEQQHAPIVTGRHCVI
jgi:hypothetical protein